MVWVGGLVCVALVYVQESTMHVQLLDEPEEEAISMHPTKAPWLNRYCGVDTFAVREKEATNCGAFTTWIVIPLLMALFTGLQVWYRLHVVTHTQSAGLLGDQCVNATFECTAVGGCTLSLLPHGGTAWTPIGTQTHFRKANADLFRGRDQVLVANGESVLLHLCSGVAEFVDISPQSPQLAVGQSLRPIRADPMDVECTESEEVRSVVIDESFKASLSWDRQGFNLTIVELANQAHDAFVDFAVSSPQNSSASGLITLLRDENNMLYLYRYCYGSHMSTTHANWTEIALDWSLDPTRITMVGAQTAFGENTPGFFLGSWRTHGKSMNMSIIYVSSTTSDVIEVDGASSFVVESNSKTSPNQYAAAAGPAGSGVAFLASQSGDGHANVFISYVTRTKGASQTSLAVQGVQFPTHGDSLAISFHEGLKRVVGAGVGIGTQYLRMFAANASWGNGKVSLKAAWLSDKLVLPGEQLSTVSSSIVDDTLFVLMPCGVIAVDVHSGSFSSLWSPLPLSLNVHGLGLSTSFLISPSSAPDYLFAGLRVPLTPTPSSLSDVMNGGLVFTFPAKVGSRVSIAPGRLSIGGFRLDLDEVATGRSDQLTLLVHNASGTLSASITAPTSFSFHAMPCLADAERAIPCTRVNVDSTVVNEDTVYGLSWLQIVSNTAASWGVFHSALTIFVDWCRRRGRESTSRNQC